MTSDRDLIISKVISGLTLFIVSTICGVIPFKLSKIFNWSEPIDQSSSSGKKSNRVVTALLCFGGGVLLATTFLHLLPVQNAEIAELRRQGILPAWKLELGELLMLAGFFLIYLIEEVVHHYLHRYQLKHKSKTNSSSDEILINGVTVRNSVHRRFSDVSCANPVTCINPAHPHSHRGSSIEQLVTSKRTQDLENSPKCQQKAEEKIHSHAHLLPQSGDDDTLVSSLRGLLIVLALSIHELFEGFAVGLQLTSAGVYYMFAAVAAHKFVISFCIGVELMVQRTKLWLAFIYVFIFSFVSAFGILIGGILTTGSMGDKLQVPNVILQGLATGTLLYVIFFEILSKDRSGVVPFVSIFTGFVTMSALQMIGEYIV